MIRPTPPGTGVCSLTGKPGIASPCKPVSSLEIPTSTTIALGFYSKRLSKKPALPIATTMLYAFLIYLAISSWLVLL